MTYMCVLLNRYRVPTICSLKSHSFTVSGEMDNKGHSFHYKIPYRTEAVETLVTLSSRVAANYIACNVGLIRRLSPAAKNILADLLGRRNQLTIAMLRVLAHSHLESVVLSGYLVRDSAVYLLSSLTRLRSLKFPGNEISTSGLIELFPHLPYLQELDISECDNATDEVLIALAKSCPKLQMINLGKCSSFGDIGFSYLASNLYSLVIIDISHTQVTDTSFKALAEGPSKEMLRELHIDGCRKLTSNCGQFLQKLTKITVISFYECPNILKSDWFEKCSDEQKKRMKNVSFTIE